MNLTFVTSDLIERMGWTLAHTVWQGAAAAALLAIALYVGKRWSATVRYPLSCAALLAIVIAASVTFALLAPKRAPHVPIAMPTHVDVSSSIAPLPDVATSSAPIPARPIDWRNRILTICVGIWMIGVFAIGLTHAFGWTWLQRCRRRATLASDAWQGRLTTLRARLNLTRRVAIFVTDRIDVPIVLGVVRPIILAPIALLNDLPPSQIEAILAHELAHIRRNDYLVNLIQTAIETLLFYHPAVWWIARRIRIERECCCDAIAAELCDDRASYVEALNAVALARTNLFQLSASFTPKRQSDLLERVRRVLDVRPKREQASGRPWIVLPLLAMLMLTSSSPVQSQSPASSPTTQAANAAHAEPSADAKALFERVKTEYSASRAAVQSIEYAYTYEINRMMRYCQFASSGDRFYHGSILRRGNAADGMAHEAAWNGQRGWTRSRLDSLVTSGTRDEVAPACPTIDSALNYYIFQAYDFQPNGRHHYLLRDASESRRDGKRFVTVTFAAEWNGGTLIVDHSCDDGYWPTHAILTDDKGDVRYELSNVMFARVPDRGREIVYPISIDQVADPKLPAHNAMHVKVDPKTLRINGSIEDSRFALARRPDETVYDFEKKTESPPADPNWVPDDRVKFPFDEMMKLAKGTPRSSATTPTTSPATQPRSDATTPAVDDHSKQAQIARMEQALAEQTAQMRRMAARIIIPVIMTERQMASGDDFTSWAELKKRVDAWSPEERAKTTIELRVSGDVDPIVVPELMRFRIDEARKAGLDNVKDAGVATQWPAWLTEAGTYVVAGDVPNPGVFSLTAQMIKAKMAVIAAGTLDKTKFINLIRRERGQPPRVILKDVLIGDLWENKVPDRYLHLDDLLVISDGPNPSQAHVAPPPTSGVTHLKLQFSDGQLTLGGEKINRAELRARLAGIPDAERSKMQIELSPGPHEASLRGNAAEYNAAKTELEKLARELQVAFAAQHVRTKDEVQPAGNVYSVSGDLVPYLTYPITARVTIRDAIARVERLQDGGYVSLFRGGGDHPPRVFENAPLSAIPDDIGAMELLAGDGLMLHLLPLPPENKR